MKIVFPLVQLFLIVIVFQSQAQYSETMNPNGIIKNLKDFGLVNDSAQNNQTSIFQQGIDNVASVGGGILVVPKGTYKIANVYMKSNVHLQIEAGTVLRPDWPDGTKVALFNFNVVWDVYKKDKAAYIENVSIRGKGGRFIVDYSNRIRKSGEGIRAIVFSMVKNFLVQDMDVIDNFSTYCGMTLSPVKENKAYTLEDVKTWKVSRPTNGTIRNCRHFNASPGYGLVQLHGAQSVYFENLYSLGGVTLRLETGANTEHIGVYDITGKNIYCENGRAALMMGPHSAKNGVVVVDSVVTKSCAYAVTIGMGGVKEGAPDQTEGYFSDSSKVTNIHAIFGKTAQIKNQSILAVPVEYYDALKLWPDNKFLTGPSIGAVTDNSKNYNVTIENVTMEGFKYNNDKKILTEADSRPGNKWDEWDKWKNDFLDDAHRTQNGAVIPNFTIPDSTLIDQKISFKDLLLAVQDDLNNLIHNFNFYPNPVKKYLYLSGNVFQSGNVYVEVFDLWGNKMLVRKNPELSGGKINTNQLLNGLYILRIVEEKTKRVLGIRKIIKSS